MAIIVQQVPNNLEPAYQDYIEFLVGSTLVLNNNFKFGFDVYTGPHPTTATNFKTRVSTFPRTNGLCYYSPTYVLQSDLTFNLNTQAGLLGQSNPQRAIQSETFYYIQFLEQWNPSASFINVSNNGGFVQYDFGLTAHGLTTNDVIDVQMDNQLINPSYNGSQSITSLFSPFIFTTDKPFGTPFVLPQSGKIYNVVRKGATSSVLRALNGARQYKDQAVNWSTRYEMNVGKANTRFLSVWPADKCKPLFYKHGEYVFSETLSYVLNPTQSIFDSFYVYEYYDNSGGLISTTTGTSQVGIAPHPYRLDLGVGPNVGITDGTLPNANITNTKVYIVDNPTGFTMSETRCYKYVQQCKDYDLIQLGFKNKLGGFDYWIFNRVSKYNSGVSRKEIKKPLRPNFRVEDRGRSVVYQDIVETWIVNTDWLEDWEALFIRELIESPEVFVLEYTQANFTTPAAPVKIPIIITSNKYDFKSSKNDMIFQYEIEYQMAYDINTNI